MNSQLPFVLSAKEPEIRDSHKISFALKLKSRILMAKWIKPLARICASYGPIGKIQCTTCSEKAMVACQTWSLNTLLNVITSEYSTDL